MVTSSAIFENHQRVEPVLRLLSSVPPLCSPEYLWAEVPVSIDQLNKYKGDHLIHKRVSIYDLVLKKFRFLKGSFLNFRHPEHHYPFSFPFGSGKSFSGNSYFISMYLRNMLLYYVHIYQNCSEFINYFGLKYEDKIIKRSSQSFNLISKYTFSWACWINFLNKLKVRSCFLLQKQVLNTVLNSY